MISKEYFNKLLATNQLEHATEELFDLFAAYMIEHKDESTSDLHNELIMFSGRIAGVQQDLKIGIIRYADAETIKTQSRFGLMNLIAKLPDDLFEFAISHDLGNKNSKEKPLTLREQVKITTKNSVWKYDVFLSFSTKDIAHASTVCNELRGYGLRVFFSDDALKNQAGSSFFDTISEALLTSKNFVLFCTPNAMHSEWVRDEYETFYQQCTLKDRKTRLFMIFAGVDFSIDLLPIMFRRFQVAFAVDEMVDKLIDKTAENIENDRIKNEELRMKNEEAERIRNEEIRIKNEEAERIKNEELRMKNEEADRIRNEELRIKKEEADRIRNEELRIKKEQADRIINEELRIKKEEAERIYNKELRKKADQERIENERIKNEELRKKEEAERIEKDRVRNEELRKKEEEAKQQEERLKNEQRKKEYEEKSKTESVNNPVFEIVGGKDDSQIKKTNTQEQKNKTKNIYIGVAALVLVLILLIWKPWKPGEAELAKLAADKRTEDSIRTQDSINEILKIEADKIAAEQQVEEMKRIADSLHQDSIVKKLIVKEEIKIQKFDYPMVQIPAGTFTMGDNKGEYYEKPEHQVKLSSFYIGTTEVTQAQWKKVMGKNPSYFKGDNLPVEQVSWLDIQKFIKKIKEITGKTYRLPTEAEWEYAAKGGQNYKYSGSDNLGDVAWYVDNSGSKTHPVGQKKPNGYGLYDMSGNVWEWCSDWYGSDYYKNSPQNNPQGASSGSDRVSRGGSWFYDADYCRSANRDGRSPDNRYYNLGFRLVLPY